MYTDENKSRMKIRIIETSKFKSLTAGIFLKRQLKREEVTLNALIPLVLKCGSKKYKSIKEIYKQAEDLNGAAFQISIVKKGEYQILQFFCETLNEPNIYKDVLNFLKELMLNPYTENNFFKKDIVDREKENLKNEIEDKINDKREYAHTRLIEEMYKNEPYGIYADGYTEDLKNINEKNLYEHYQNIIKDSEFEVMLLGKVKKTEAEKYIKELFLEANVNSKESPTAKAHISAPSSFKISQNGIKEISEIMHISQCKLCIGIKSSISPVGDEIYALMLGNEIFGGGANSRLFTNIREKQSLCYYISSSLLRFKASLSIEAGIDFKDYEKIVQNITAELEKIKQGEFSNEDIENAKTSLLKKYSETTDYLCGLMDFYLSQDLLNDKDDIKDIIKRIKKINKQDICSIMKKTFVDCVYFLKGEES